MDYKFILSLVFAVVIAVFAIQNSSTVDVNFLFANFSASQALVILISSLFGAIIAMLLGVVRTIKKTSTIKEYERNNEELKKENTQLKEQVELLAAEKESLRSEQPLTEEQSSIEDLNVDIENEKTIQN